MMSRKTGLSKESDQNFDRDTKIFDKYKDRRARHHSETSNKGSKGGDKKARTDHKMKTIGDFDRAENFQDNPLYGIDEQPSDLEDTLQNAYGRESKTENSNGYAKRHTLTEVSDQYPKYDEKLLRQFRDFHGKKIDFEEIKRKLKKSDIFKRNPKITKPQEVNQASSASNRFGYRIAKRSKETSLGGGSLGNLSGMQKRLSKPSNNSCSAMFGQKILGAVAENEGRNASKSKRHHPPKNDVFVEDLNNKNNAELDIINFQLNRHNSELETMQNKVYNGAAGSFYGKSQPKNMFFQSEIQGLDGSP
jgi:hypothetical protein